MAMEDSFITKLENLEDFSTLFEKKERFGKYNDKTLGFLLVKYFELYKHIDRPYVSQVLPQILLYMTDC